jgi:hypothetical protein
MIHFSHENGSPKIVHSKNAWVPTTSILGRTAERRSGAFDSFGPLAHLKPIIYAQGKIDRNFLIEEINVGNANSANSDNSTDPQIQSRNVSARSILASVKNSFRESDNVEQIESLTIWDLMYIQFVDDSHVYAISVKDSSKTVWTQGTALCNITHKEWDKEVTQEWIIRLPLQINHNMFATAGAKKILSLNKTISNIKLRRRSNIRTH